MKENKYNKQKISQKGHFTQKDELAVRTSASYGKLMQRQASPMEHDDQVEGRNSVLELLESGRDINKIYIQAGEKHGSIYKIIAMAKEKKILISEIDKNKMKQMAQTENYQGVIAIVPPFEYAEVEDILEEAKNKNEDPFIIILDGIEDVHNLGSIIRTAETAGAHGVIIPKRRAAAVNAIVNKVSAGAVEHVKIADRKSVV